MDRSTPLDKTLAKHRIKPEWHRRARSIAQRVLGHEWQSKADQEATLVVDITTEIRDAVEADSDRAELIEAMRKLLDAAEAEAKAALSAEVAKDNFSDPRPDVMAYEREMVRSMEEHRAARALLSRLEDRK